MNSPGMSDRNVKRCRLFNPPVPAAPRTTIPRRHLASRGRNDAEAAASLPVQTWRRTDKRDITAAADENPWLLALIKSPVQRANEGDVGGRFCTTSAEVFGSCLTHAWSTAAASCRFKGDRMCRKCGAP